MVPRSYPTRQFLRDITLESAEETLRLLKRHYPQDTPVELLSAAKDILYLYHEELIGNSQLFTSDRHGASFPWSVVEPGVIASKLCRPCLHSCNENKQVAGAKIREEYIFGSTLSPYSGGNQFTFFELGLHRAINFLPNALNAIALGEQFATHRIYILGLPTTDTGNVSERFVKTLKQNTPFKIIGDLYGEFIKSMSSASVNDKHVMIFRGISMGASFAIATAQHILDSRMATQNWEEAKRIGCPMLRVRIDTAVAQTDFRTARRLWQLPVGFFVHALIEGLTNPYLRITAFGESRFRASVEPLLRRKGVPPHMSPIQAKLKKAGLRCVLSHLLRGHPVPTGMKLTEVVGLYDLTTLSLRQTIKFIIRSRHRPRSLGLCLIGGERPRRRFGVAFGHTIPQFKGKELRRLKIAAGKVNLIQPG